MRYRKQTLNNANSPGLASDQGVEHWGPNDDSEIDAVTDVVYVQPAYGVEIFALENDIGSGLVITSVSVRNPTDGEVTTDGTTVMYLTDEHFHYLDCGETTQVTLDYTITDNLGRTDSGFILVNIEQPFALWADEDNSPIEDEDGAWIAMCPVALFEWWIDEDDAVIEDESGDHVLTLES